MNNIEIRFDDVLLSGFLTKSMKNSLRHNSFFEHFKEADKILEENNLHCALAIVGAGIDEYPEWVEYIKQRMHRYTIAMHCWEHNFHHGMKEEKAFEELARAKAKIEEAFGVPVTRWYVPFGRLYFPEWGLRVSNRLGIEFDLNKETKRHFYFHYWNSRDRLRLLRLIEKHGIELTKAN